MLGHPGMKVAYPAILMHPGVKVAPPAMGVHRGVMSRPPRAHLELWAASSVMSVFPKTPTG